MPQGDGTGPMGSGPMTGKTLGRCAGYGISGSANPFPGRGFGRGLGRCRHFMARGRRISGRTLYDAGVPFTAPTREEEKRFLQEQSEVLQSQLDEIGKRLESLTGQETPKA
ncbi:DUF5320 domain-containing protein [Desulfobacterales bacterium HSG2]|nr:DUF5320 domain-containing protein [Desulfobacterales bacterium HSG2]